MAYVICKPRRFDISCLPADIKVTIPSRELDQVTAEFADKAETVCLPLSVSKDGAKLCATIPEQAACYGPGKYYVRFVHDCVKCAEVCVRFVADCSPVNTEVVQQPQEKPRKGKDG